MRYLLRQGRLREDSQGSIYCVALSIAKVRADGRALKIAACGAPASSDRSGVATPSSDFVIVVEHDDKPVILSDAGAIIVEMFAQRRDVLVCGCRGPGPATALAASAPTLMGSSRVEAVYLYNHAPCTAGAHPVRFLPVSVPDECFAPRANEPHRRERDV
jgi:hypothetical protein